MARKYIKQNDTKPSVRATLYTVSGDPPQPVVVNLSGSTVRFIMRQRGQSVAKVDASATIVGAATGQVQYDWIAADTDTCGEYLVEFEVTDSGGDIQTFWDLRTAADIDDEKYPEPLLLVIVDDFG